MLKKRFFKTKDEVEVTFQVDRPDIGTVEWAAEVTGWDPIPMRRTKDGKGPFRLKVRLPKDDDVQFRYRLDG